MKEISQNNVKYHYAFLLFIFTNIFLILVTFYQNHYLKEK